MRSFLLLALSLAAGAITPAFADTIGTTVTATLTQQGSSTNLFLTPTAKIGAGTEFSYTGSGFTITVDFSNTQATVTVNDPQGANTGIFNLLFSDPSFTGASKVSGPLGFAPVGPTSFRLNTGGAGLTASSTTLINITSAPEPSSLVLLASGIIGLAGVARRRFLLG